MSNPFEVLDNRLNKVESLLSKVIEILEDSNSIDPNEKLTVKAAAKELNVSELTIRNYLKKGILKANKIGRIISIPRIEIEKALKEYKSLKYKR